MVAEQVAAEQMLRLAWYVEHGRFWASPEDLSWVGASLRLLRAFADAGGRRVVIAGTGAQYDWSKVEEPCLELPRRERAATLLCPSRPYGTAKQATHVADVARLREGVGFYPAIDLDQGIADAVTWWRNAA